MRPDRLAALSLWLELRLGRRADQIIANSRAGMSRLIEQGMPEQRIAVVHNGIDSDYYTPSPELRSSTRSSWNLDDSDIVIGLPARLDPLKDHSAFLKAAKIVVNTYPNVRFVCAGGGDPVYAEELLRLSDELGLDQSVLWLGEVQDMRSVYATLDIAVLCSISESFPNALCEAMACGVPCIATNVGDCAQIVGDTGIMVRPGESMGLAEAILVMIQRIHVEHKLGIAARERIVSRYGLRRMVEETEKVLLQAVAKKGG